MKKQELKAKVKALRSEVDNLSNYLFHFKRSNQELKEQIEELKKQNGIEKLYNPINVFGLSTGESGNFFRKTIEQSKVTPEQEILKTINEAKLMNSIIEALVENETGTFIECNYARVVKGDRYTQVANSVVSKLKDN